MNSRIRLYRNHPSDCLGAPDGCENHAAIVRCCGRINFCTCVSEPPVGVSDPPAATNSGREISAGCTWGIRRAADEDFAELPSCQRGLEDSSDDIPQRSAPSWLLWPLRVPAPPRKSCNSTATFVSSSRTIASCATGRTRTGGRRICGWTSAAKRWASQAIVPGKPEESEVVARIYSTDADVLMPPPESNKKLIGRAEGDHQTLDRRGRRVSRALGVRAAGQACDAGRRQRASIIWCGERLGRSGTAVLARSRSPHAREAAVLRPDRPAAEAGRGRRLRRRRIAPGVRQPGREVAGLAAVRRTDGDSVAGRGPLCRHDRLPLGQPARTFGRIAIT